MVEPDHIISSSDVRRVLDSALRGDLPHDVEPLDNLFVVERHLIERDLPIKPLYRRLALVDLLSSEISEAYKQQRLWANRQLPSDDLSLQLMKQLIREDCDPNGNSVILGWLWLYLKYVTRIPELRSSIFTQYAHVDRRTLRRYQSIALHQLTVRLIRLEIEARTRQRQTRLKARLPRLGRIKCIGRDGEIQWIADLLRSDRYEPVVIIGAQGVGKTVLAESVASHLIEDDLLDSVIWLENIQTVKAIEDHLREQLLEDSSTTTLQEFLVLRRVLIVLDNVDPGSNPIHFEHELQRLHGARLIITCRSVLKLHGSQAIRLDGLNFHATVQFLEHLDYRKAIPRSSLAHVAGKLHQLTAGNPSQLEDQYRQYVLFRTLIPISKHQEDWCRTVYEQLSPDARLAWAVLSIGPMRYSDIVDGHFPDIREEVLRVLQDYLVVYNNIEQNNITNLLPLTTCQFAHSIYSQDKTLQSALQSWVMRVASVEPLTDALVNFMEQVLQAYWIGMNDEWRSQWIQRMWWNGVVSGTWSLWAALLEAELARHPVLSETSMMLTIGYAMCLRRLGHIVRAAGLLESILHATQQSMSPRAIILIHLELAMVNRGKGDYSKSMHFLGSADDSLHPNSLPEDCVQWIRAVQSQIYIDSGRFSEAEELLNQTDPTSQINLIRAELSIRQDKFELAENTVFDMLSTSKLTPTVIARAYALLGLSRQTQGDLYNAKRFFAISEATLETNTDDPYGIARAKSNLAAVLIELGRYREAAQLLQDAARIQKAIQDRVGLATTVHNQRILNRKQ